MNTNVECMINQAVYNTLEKCSSHKKIKSLYKRHNVKIHFVPKKYRVFGGLLQSMNIQFGNFIEELMSVLIANEYRYEILEEYSGKKSNSFTLSDTNERRIDSYITRCQAIPELDQKREFSDLLESIISDTDTNKNTFKHDIDLLFKNKQTGQIYYLEIKYNDDHDTGKFVDINRKFIKTYAYLVKELNITTKDGLVPLLFFFTNKRMKGNIYIPEETNIRRGKAFFDEFLSVRYSEVDEYMSGLSESDAVVQMFHNLYLKIMNEE